MYVTTRLKSTLNEHSNGQGKMKQETRHFILNIFLDVFPANLFEEMSVYSSKRNELPPLALLLSTKEDEGVF